MIGFWADFFTFLQVAIGLFLIFIIMLQRGKGGGLVGALGGMGGASAFGPKADIQVLKLTIGLAIAWVVIACVGIFFNRSYAGLTYNPVGDNAGVKKDAKDKDAEKGGGKDADKGAEKGASKAADEASGKAAEKTLEKEAEKNIETDPELEKAPKATPEEKTPAGEAEKTTPEEKPATKSEPETKK